MNVVVSEDVMVKAVRLLATGRVTVQVPDGRVVANVQGATGATYLVTGGPNGLVCSCPALRECAHLFAVARVVPGPWR